MSQTGSAQLLATPRPVAPSRPQASHGQHGSIDQVQLERLLIRAGERARRGNHDRAYALYDDALSLQRGLGRPPEETAATLAAMARARLGAGDARAAGRLYEAALELAPNDALALAGVCHVAVARGDRADARRRARAVSGGRDVLVTAGEHAAGDLADPIAAIILLAAALGFTPRDPALLGRIAELARVAGRRREAADATLALAELEVAPERRGRLYHRAGRLVRAVDLEQAARLYELALDAYFAPGSLADRDRPSAWAPFGDLERLLTRDRAWSRLERAYRSMIRRLRPEDAEVGTMWQRLGAINRERLGRPDAARRSFEVAAALDGERLSNHRVLVELYGDRGGGELDRALASRRRLLLAEPFVADHARALRELFHCRGMVDRAYLAAQLASYLGGAGAPEEQLVRRHRPGQLVPLRRPLGDEEWAALRHPGEDPRMTQILGTVAKAIALARALPPRKLKLRDDRGPHTAQLRATVAAVARALGMPEPAVAIDPELDADVLLANLRQRDALVPTFVLGRQLLRPHGAVDVAIALGRSLTHARPAYYLRLLLADDRAIGAAWAAALAVAGAGPCVADDPMVLAVTRHLDPVWRAQLIGAVRGHLESGAVADPGAWCRAVDALARRVGVLLGGDLAASAAALHREPRHAAVVPQGDRLADLVLFWMSDEHARLRRDLGLAVE